MNAQCHPLDAPLVLALLRGLHDRSPVPVAVVSAAGSCLYANGAFESAAGPVRLRPLLAAEEPGWILTPIGDGTGPAEAYLVRRSERNGDDRLDPEVRLERAERDMQTFVYIASHDLQEPLRTITSGSNLVLRRSGHLLDEKTSEFFGFVVDAAKRMSGLIDDLLRFSRIGRVHEPFVEVSLERLVDGAAATISAKLLALGATLTRDALPVVMGEPELLRQVFVELIDNALKYRGEAPLRLHISAREHPAGAEIVVRDNGLGIDPAHQGRLFNIFKRLHVRAHIPGSGAGLAIVRRIVEHHDGDVWIVSDGTLAVGAAGGTAIHLTLPVRRTPRTSQDASP